VQVGVVDLDACGRGDVTGDDGPGARLAQVHDHGLVVLRGEDDLLDVEDDLCDILLDPFDGAELVGHTVNADRGDRSPGDRGEQGPTQGVPQRVAEAGLEGLEGEAGAEVADLLLGQDGSLCNEHVLVLSSRRPPYDAG